MTNDRPADAGGGSAPAQFYIPATTSIMERRPRTLKHGDTFGLFDHSGDAISGEGSPDGIYHKDTRHLSNLRLLLNGRRPLLLSSTVQDNNAVLTVDLTNPDFVSAGHIDLHRDMIHIVRSKFLWDGACHERLGIRNFDRTPRTIELTLLFDVDFADIFEVRGHRRERRGHTSVDLSPDSVSYVHKGLDGVIRRTVVQFDPKPEQLVPGSAIFRFRIPPGNRCSVFASISCEHELKAGPSAARRFFIGLRDARRALRRSTARAAAIETSNAIFNEVLCRGMADLYMLLTDTEHGPYPYAGIPWFSTAFGRDAIITAIEMLWIDPAIAKGVLHFLAATQAKEVNPDAEAQPGKILHETRSGEMAHLGEVPFSQYYGSVDSTPLFICLAGQYLERTGDMQTVSDLWPRIEAALSWIDEYGDCDGDGFVEYMRTGATGLVNQGWKDSFDSIFHADGRCAEGTIALCEVQGYVYAAKREAAKIAAAIGYPARGEKLREEAQRLRQKLEAAFWCPDIGTYALALDGDKRPCKVRSSNAGHLLFSGAVSKEHAEKVAEQFMGRAFFTGWGIRTVASTEGRFNPMSYHNGSIWPHDNALIGLGLARYGLKHPLQRLFEGIFDAAVYMELRRLPELFCGFQRKQGEGPTFYPVACIPQAWSSAAPFALLQACLGLEFQFASNCVYFRQPRLPSFLDEVVLRSIAVGSSRLDILLRRYGEDVSVNVLRRTGDAEVVVTV